jgi:TRAP-type C4-dicarboxylate transport system permease large subunit
MALFVVAKVGDIPFPDLVRETWPLVMALIVVLLMCTFSPGVVMALPNLLLGASV